MGDRKRVAVAVATAAVDPKLLTPKEVCGLLGIDESTLWRWRQDHTGPPYICLGRTGRTIRYERHTLRVWIKANLEV